MKDSISISQVENLIRGLKDSNTVAFDRIYNLYAVKVFNFSRKFLQSDEDAQEIVQDVFFKLWEARQNIDLAQPFNGYIFRIAKNAALNKIRKRVGEPDTFSPVRNDISSMNLTEQDVLLKETEDLLETAIDGLPPKRQEIFRLSRYECLSNKEIAERMGISINTVEGQMRKAIKYLRSYMEWVSMLIVWVSML